MLEINEKYKPLFSEDYRYAIIIGGRGSGKSFGTNVFNTLLTFEEGHKILFTRYTMTSAHLSVIPELEEKIDLMGYNHYFDIKKTEVVNLSTNNEIIFRGIKTSSGNNTANLKSLQGVTTWVLDEAEELRDEETFDKIDLSIRQKGVQNRVILIMNPTTADHWVYKRFFESRGITDGFNGIKEDTLYIHTTYLDNIANLDQGFLNRVEQIKLNDPNKYNHTMLGAWIKQSEGAIFKNWEIGLFDESLPYGFGADFGFSVDPDTLVKVAIDEKKKTIYCDEYLYSFSGLGTDELAQRYKQLIPKIKDLIVADSAEGRLISDIKKKGVNIIECEKGAGSVLAGIVAMQDYKIVITERSVNLAKELRLYEWNDKKSGIPIDAYNHLIDAIRYIFRKMQNKPKSNSKLLGNLAR